MVKVKKGHFFHGDIFIKSKPVQWSDKMQIPITNSVSFNFNQVCTSGPLSFNSNALTTHLYF